MIKRVILNLPEDLVDQLDEEWNRLGMPSRNSYLEQVVRKHLGLPNVFEEQGG